MFFFLTIIMFYCLCILFMFILNKKLFKYTYMKEEMQIIGTFCEKCRQVVCNCAEYEVQKNKAIKEYKMKEAMGGYLKIEKQFLPGKSTADFTDAELGQIVKKCSYYVSKDDAIKEAVEVLCNALREDPSYYSSWQANIAMAFHDEFGRFILSNHNNNKLIPDFQEVVEKLPDISNKAAENFLNLLIQKK